MAVDRTLTLGTLFTGKVDASFRNTVRQLKKIMDGLVTTQTKQKKVTKEQEKVARAFGIAMKNVGAHMRRAAPEVKKMSGFMDKFRISMFGARGAMDSLMRAFSIVSVFSIASRAIFAVTNALRQGVTAVIDYDQALRNLQAITRASAVQIQAMGDVITRVSNRTRFSATEVAEGMVLLGQAGFSAAEVIASMDAVANLATGTLSEMKTVSDLLTTTIRAFGLEATEANRVADVMATSINRSKLTVDKLRIAFNFVGAAAAQSGVSLEEISAAMQTLANNGLRASTIGTGLRQVLRRLIAPNRKLREEFEAQGVNLNEVNPQIVGFEKSLESLVKVLFDAETGTVDMGKAFSLFGLRGAQAASIIVKSFVSGSFQTALENVFELGTAEQMAKIQAEGLEVILKNLQDRAKNLGIAFGKGTGLTEVFRVFLKTVSATILILQDFFEGIGGGFVKIALLTNAIIALRIALNLLVVKVIPAAISAFLSFGAVLLLNPFIAVATAIAGAIVLIQHFATENKKAADSFAKSVVVLKGTIATLNTYTKALIESKDKLTDSRRNTLQYQRTIQELKRQFPELASLLNESTEAFDDNVQVLKEFKQLQINKAIDNSVEAINKYNEAVKDAGFWTGLWEITLGGIKATFDEIISGPFFTWIKNVLKLSNQIGDAVLSPFGLAGGVVDDAIKDIIDSTTKFGKELNANTEETKKLSDANKELAGILAQQVAEGTKLKKIIRGISGLDLSLRDQFLLVKELKRLVALQKEIKIVGGAIREAFKGLPTIFKKTFDSLDDEGKIEFIKFTERLQKKIAALEDNAVKQLGLDLKTVEDKRRLEELVTTLIFEELKKRQDKIDEAQLKIIRANQRRKKAVLKIAENLAKEHEKELKAEFDLFVKSRKAIVQIAKNLVNERAQELKRDLGNTQKWSDEQIKIMRELLSLEKITEREFWEFRQEKRRNDVVQTGTFWQRIGLAAEEALGRTKNMAERVQDIIQSSVESFATGLADAMINFADGTKSAQEAFADFANSFLRQVAQMIIKLAILKAIQAATGTSTFTQFFHDGGIVGSEGKSQRIDLTASTAPRFHEGVGPGETAAIIRNDEGVFTPGQMKALGERGDGGGTSTVNVTIQAVDARSFAQLAASNPQAIIGPITNAIRLGNRGLISTLKGVK